MTGYRTAEVRWFLRGPLPEAVAAWFDRLGGDVEVEVRTDRYLAPVSDGLGVKVRDGRLEAKRRDRRLDLLRAGRAEGAVEAWTKWSFPLAHDAVPGAGWKEVRKLRRQRGRRAGAGTCVLEVGEVETAGAVWWTVCLEADGLSQEARLRALVETAGRWLGIGDAPTLPAGAAGGYPAWLLEAAP